MNVETDKAEVVALLEGAKRELFESGWCKRYFVTPVTGEICLSTALARGQASIWKGSKDHVYYQARQAVVDALPEMLVRSVVVFNDASKTTFDDVINVIDQAIIAVKELPR